MCSAQRGDETGREQPLSPRRGWGSALPAGATEQPTVQASVGRDRRVRDGALPPGRACPGGTGSARARGKGHW